MSTLLLTLTLAFVLTMGALALLALSWLITGKSKLQAGACGRDPTIKRNEKNCHKEVSCHLCEKSENKKK